MTKKACKSCGEKILIASTDDPTICAECAHVPEVASAVAVIGKVSSEEPEKVVSRKANWKALNS